MESLALCVRLESLTYGSVMNDNPYASPKTHQESPIDRRRRAVIRDEWRPVARPARRLAGRRRDHDRVLHVHDVVCERIESAVGPRGMNQGVQWLYGIAILGVPILLGKATAVIYKRQYVRIASEIDAAEPTIARSASEGERTPNTV